jgi:hypothetical protein
MQGGQSVETVTKLLLTAAAMIVAVASPAWAYVGPGAGLTVIGAALAFLAAIVLAIIGFVWYPIKRLVRAVAARRAKAAETPVDNPSS